jgi:hypothetical protein
VRTSLLTTMLLAALTVGSLSAQDEARPSNVRKGFWIGFGGGAGVNLSEGLDGDQLWGGNGYLRMGGTTKSNLLLGGEAIGWVVEDDNSNTLERGNVHFVAIWYPNVKSGFYLKGGIGGASIGQSQTSGNTTTSTHKGGFGAGLGTGYELQIGRNLYLVPSADFLLQLFSSENDPVLGHIPGSNTMLLFNLGLTWH